ncbi:MAG: YicC family protein [Flavobacteriaceae bacterium]|nr:YicC family protein [Flavobacteriaceae bacterium]
MISSMTGFGKSELIEDSKTITIEIRTLNSKTIDINSRLPQKYKELDILLRKKIIKSLKRGKIDFSVTHKLNEENSTSFINKKAVENYISQLKDIQSFKESDLLSIAMRLPETLKTEKKEINEKEKSDLLSLLDKTLAEVISFRDQEGKILHNDFINRSKLLNKYLKQISKIDINRKKLFKEKLKNEIKKIKVDIDQNRFEQEMIYYIEKIDITEEKIRLSNHISYFVQTLNSDNSQGKKLAFICQEIGREINTIGSKANNFEIQKIIVQMKDELEKIKEQLLNIL